MRKCKKCRESCEKPLKTPAGTFCDYGCAIAYARQKQREAADRKRRKQRRDDKLRIKSKGQWAKEAQAAFNRFIRLRDSGQPCISCGRHHEGQYHAGHYRSVGSSPELRFEENNCSLQCAPCNNHLSGNIVNYRPALIKKIGIDLVEWLEGPHEPKRYTIEDLMCIKENYIKKANELQKKINQGE